MTQEADQELLSAYLDGELSADEQARVERLLAESQAFRQLHDELRALRSSFEALPRYRLPHDLSGQVLRLAEQAMLKGAGLDGKGLQGTGQDGTRDEIARDGFTHDGGEPEPLRLRLPRGWRPWLWPAFALAAALLVMIFNPQHPREPRKLAKAPTDPPDIAISAAPQASAAPRQNEQAANPGQLAPENNGSPTNNAGEVADAKAQDKPAPAAATAERQSGLNRSAEQTTNSAPAPETPLSKEANRSAAPVTASDATKQVQALRSEPAAPKASAAPSEDMAEKASPSKPLDADRKAVGQNAVEAASGPARRSLAKGSAARAEDAAGGLGGRPAMQDAAGGEVLNAMEGVLVVELVMRPEAARDGAFDKLLAKNKITLERPTQVALRQNVGQQVPQQDAVKREAAKEAATKQEADRPDAAPVELAAAAAPGFGGLPARPSESPAKGDAAIPIYVEASRQQIKAALVEMYQDRQKFVALRVQPAAYALSQQGLGAFTRLPPAPNAPSAAGSSPTVAGSPNNSAPSAAGAPKPAFNIRWGVAQSNAPTTTPGQPISTDPLLASPARAAAGGNQAASDGGVLHMKSASGLTIPGGPTGHVRVLFLIHIAKLEAPAAPAPAAESEPPAAGIVPPAAGSPIPKVPQE